VTLILTGLLSVNPETEPGHSISLVISLKIRQYSEIKSSGVTVTFVSTVHKKYDYEPSEEQPSSIYKIFRVRLNLNFSFVFSSC
jgi:hypothetical protein